MSKIKLYFLTGFLGAGKTTILRNLLENMEGTKVGVIQNELGKISIDGTVLQNNDIQMIELNRGSIFCSCLRLSFVDALTQMATLIFDTMKKVHGLGRRERLLLQVAAILHDCGKFISMSAPGECAYQIIMSTEILGISHMEREMVASIVRYNTMELPNFNEFDGKLGNDEYLIVMKLAAILRVCNALDRSHRQKFADMKLTIKDSNIVITTAYPDNITLEKKTLQDKQDFFEEVYGLGFEIKQKKKKQ